MRNFTIMILCFLTSFAKAQGPSLDDISQTDLDTIVKEFSANFAHTSATPPTSLGKVFGAEAAMIVGAVESPGVEKISKGYDPDTDIKYLPHLWLLGGVSIPYGVSVELNIMPKLDVQEVKMSHTSVALKWSVTDQFFKGLPFDLALRTYYSKSEVSYSQTITNGVFPGSISSKISFENKMIGGDTLLGFDLNVAEPYIGLGFLKTEGTLGAIANSSSPYSIFSDGSSQSRTSKQDTVRIIAGCQFSLTGIKVGLEYSHLFSVSRVSAKMGLSF